MSTPYPNRELELRDNKNGICEYCERPAKYVVKVMSMCVWEDNRQQGSVEIATLRCAYHKNSSRPYYETEYNSFQSIH